MKYQNIQLPDEGRYDELTLIELNETKYKDAIVLGPASSTEGGTTWYLVFIPSNPVEDNPYRAASISEGAVIRTNNSQWKYVRESVVKTTVDGYKGHLLFEDGGMYRYSHTNDTQIWEVMRGLVRTSTLAEGNIVEPALPFELSIGTEVIPGRQYTVVGVEPVTDNFQKIRFTDHTVYIFRPNTPSDLAIWRIIGD